MHSLGAQCVRAFPLRAAAPGPLRTSRWFTIKSSRVSWLMLATSSGSSLKAQLCSMQGAAAAVADQACAQAGGTPRAMTASGPKPASALRVLARASLSLAAL